jgi:hypothetical protein
MAKDIYKNPESKSVNQTQGPRRGNEGTTSKRDSFIESKAGSKSTDLAKMVLDALETRGKGMAPHLEPSVEPLSENRGPKRNPTAGGTKYNAGYTKAPSPRPAKKK